MQKQRNSALIQRVLESLFEVTGRRESEVFAAMAMDSIIQTMQQKYDFLKYVKIRIEEGLMIGSQDVTLDINQDIVDTVEPKKVGEAIESIIRIVLMDLGAKAGLFFINEFKKKLGNEYLPELRKIGVNLGNMQLEQRYLYARMEKGQPTMSSPSEKATQREKYEQNQEDPVSIFGYEWENVKEYKFDTENMTYTLFDKNGNKLDSLSLDSIVNKLSRIIEIESEGYDASSTKDDQHKIKNLEGIEENIEKNVSQNKEDENINITKKEYQFLEMLFEQDMDADTATQLLEISKNDLQYMVKRLLKFKILKQSSQDVVELSEFGINYMMSLYGA